MNILACDFWWLLSGKDYWYAIVSAVIGALIGIWWTKKQFRISGERLQIKNKRLLGDSVNFNLTQLKQIIDGFKPDSAIIPNFPLDPRTLFKRIDDLIDVLPKDLTTALTWQRYQLEHLELKIAFLNSTSDRASEKFHSQLSDLYHHSDLTHRELGLLKSSL